MMANVEVHQKEDPLQAGVIRAVYPLVNVKKYKVGLLLIISPSHLLPSSPLSSPPSSLPLITPSHLPLSSLLSLIQY